MSHATLAAWTPRLTRDRTIAWPRHGMGYGSWERVTGDVSHFGRSFAGSETAEPEWSVTWMLGPHLATRGNEERTEMCTFYMSFAFALKPAKVSTTICTLRPDGDHAGSTLVLGGKQMSVPAAGRTLHAACCRPPRICRPRWRSRPARWVIAS